MRRLVPKGVEEYVQLLPQPTGVNYSEKNAFQEYGEVIDVKEIAKRIQAYWLDNYGMKTRKRKKYQSTVADVVVAYVQTRFKEDEYDVNAEDVENYLWGKRSGPYKVRDKKKKVRKKQFAGS